MKALKAIIIWLFGIVAVSFILMQLYYVAYLFKNYKSNFFTQTPFTLDVSILFRDNLHTKVTLSCLGIFSLFMLFQMIRPFILERLHSHTEEGDKINYTKISTKFERKKGLLRVEFTRKGKITTSTIRWKLDRMFNGFKVAYNKVLEYFKVNPKHYLNTFKVNKNTFNVEPQFHAGGIPLIVERKFFNLFGPYCRFYLSTGNIHSLFIGSTGRGKSVTFVIVMLYFYCLAGENVMLNDPKGELYDATRELFKNNGYNVIVLDYQNTSNSQINNPLQIPKEIYKREVTSHLFYLKVEDENIEDNESSYFLLNDKEEIELLGEKVSIFLKNDEKVSFEINSSYLEGYKIGLYVVRVYHWSKNNVVQGEPELADASIVKDKAFSYNLKEKYEDGSHNVSETIEMLRDIANTITFEEGVRDPFWNVGAADMITGGALLLLEQGAIEEFNFKSIRLLYDNDEKLMEFVERTTDISSYSRKYLSTYLNATGNTKASLKAVFSSKMSLLDANENIAKVTSNDSSFDLTKVGFEKTAIFIIVHDEKKTYHPLVSMFTKQLYETLVNEIRKRKLETLPVPFNLILDEFGVMPPLKDVDAILAAARSRSIRFNAFVQSFEQLQQTYGKEIAKVIEDNCTNVIYLNSKTDSAAEYFEKMAGNKLIKTKNGYKTVPVLTKERLKQFPKGQSLITTIEKKPYISKLPPVFKYPFYVKSSVYRDNIEHAEVKIYDISKRLEALKFSKNDILFKEQNEISITRKEK